VGIAQLDLVAAITGDEFGETNTISTIIYVIVGLAGIWLLQLLPQFFSSEERV
jgi:uncharacterized membrane protein YuzA (DUF378 family)